MQKGIILFSLYKQLNLGVRQLPQLSRISSRYPPPCISIYSWNKDLLKLVKANYICSLFISTYFNSLTARDHAFIKLSLYIDFFFEDNTRGYQPPPSINIFDSSNLFLISWLYKLQFTRYFCSRNNLYYYNKTYSKPSFIKVVDILILDPPLIFDLLYLIKLLTNNLRIFTEYSLVINPPSKSCFNLQLLFSKLSNLILPN